MGQNPDKSLSKAGISCMITEMKLYYKSHVLLELLVVRFCMGTSSSYYPIQVLTECQRKSHALDFHCVTPVCYCSSKIKHQEPVTKVN